MVYAAERMEQLVNDPEITSPEVRRVPTNVPKVGVGAVEAPRGTLFHHYETDEKGLIRKANMVVATGNNAALIAMSVERAAKGLIKGGKVTEGLRRSAVTSDLALFEPSAAPPSSPNGSCFPAHWSSW